MSRRWRWLVEYDLGDTTVTDCVKVAARPNITIEETEINYLSAKTWVPTKGTWEAITITHFDQTDETMKPLWDYMAKVYSYWEKKEDVPDELRATITLKLMIPERCPACLMTVREYKPLERWILKKAHPTAINFGDLDFSSSESITIELTWKYEEAEYENYCPKLPKSVPHASSASPMNLNLGVLGIQDHHPKCTQATKSGPLRSASDHPPSTPPDPPFADTQQPRPNYQKSSPEGQSQSTTGDSTPNPSSSEVASASSDHCSGLFRGGFLRSLLRKAGWL